MWGNEAGRRRSAVLALVAAAFFFANAAAAQLFRLGSWDGSLEGVTELTRQDTKTGAAERSRFDRRHMDERLLLRNSGMYFYDPRLVNLSLGGTVGLSQDRMAAAGVGQDSGAILSGYDAFASILPEQRLSLNFFANRNQSVVSRELAGRTDVVTENRGLTLFARRLYVPSTLNLRQELQEEESIAANVTSRRANRRNILRYEGQRGWIDSEMDLLYEFVDDSDEVFPKLSFQSHQGQLGYSLDFGEELNRRWDSKLRYTTRTGLVESTMWTVEETLRIDHTERLRTDYRYSLVRNEAPTSETTTHSAAASLQHRLYESLTTTAGLDGVRQALAQGEKDSARSRLNLAYTRRLPLGGRVTAGVGGSFQYEDDRFKATEIPVSAESHAFAAPIALPIALRNPLVVTPSIVVAKIATVAVPAGCLAPGPGALPAPLTAGVDFDIRASGDVTEIVPRACTAATLGINPGDTIAVDYRFRVAPAMTFTTAAWQGDFSVDYRWFRVFGSHQQSMQDLISGRGDHFLDDQRSDAVGAELRYDHPRLRGGLLGEARRFVSGRARYDSLRTTAHAAFALFADLTLRLSGDRTVTDFPDEGRQTRSLAGRAAVNWAPGANLFVDLSGGVQTLEDTRQPSQQTSDARLFVRWLFRKIEVGPTLEYSDRQYGDTVAREYRVIVRTIRRF